MYIVHVIFQFIVAKVVVSNEKGKSQNKVSRKQSMQNFSHF